jgi:hypothetical protein
MEPSEKNPAPIETHDDIGWDELLQGVRAGDAAAVRELERLLSPGVRLMIRRRDGHHDAQIEAQSVLDAAVSEIRADLSLDAAAVVRLVRLLIQRRFPANSHPPAMTPNWEPGLASRGMDAAGRILQEMSPVDRDALRRCYVLGENTESILNRLNLSSEHYKAIKSRARAQFSAEVPQKLNVA